NVLASAASRWNTASKACSWPGGTARDSMRVAGPPAAVPGRRGSLAGPVPRRSFEPVVQVDLGALAEVGAEPALAAQPGQLASARAGHDEPVPADDGAVHRARVLQQEGALAPGQRPGHPLDPDEARGPICAASLQELDHAVALDVPAEALLHVDSGQHRSPGRLVVGRRLVFVHGDDRARAGSIVTRVAHRSLPPFRLAPDQSSSGAALGVLASLPNN